MSESGGATARVAVTGASGNLGSAVLRRLGPVLGIARRCPAPPSRRPDQEWLPLDIAADDAQAVLTDAFAGCESVVHLAWQLQPGRDLDRLWRVNVEGTQTVVRSAIAAGVRHLVVASSVGAYSPGPKTEPVDESWPVKGVERSSYSRQKAAVEAFLDVVEAQHPDVVITRLRPALVLQSRAGREITGLFLGRLFPPFLAGGVRVPALPLPRQLQFQVVHADDVAEAVALALVNRPRGGLNVAAEPMLRPDDLARALGAGRSIPLPLGILRGVASASWHARLQPTEPGWIDLVAAVPWMSTERVRRLGWTPAHTGPEALAEIVRGIRDRSGDPALPPLRGERRWS